MTDKEIIIDGVDVSGCEFYNKDDKTCREANGKYNIDICDFDKCESSNCYYKQLKRKEQECEELHNRTASIIYSLTGGRLSYSTYTLEGCEQAYHDQLEIDVERATKELQEENETLKQEVEELKEEHKGCRIGIKDMSIENTEICKISEKYKRALDEIENYVRDNSDFDKSDKLTSNTGAYDILEIINKAKDVSKICRTSYDTIVEYMENKTMDRECKEQLKEIISIAKNLVDKEIYNIDTCKISSALYELKGISIKRPSTEEIFNKCPFWSGVQYQGMYECMRDRSICYGCDYNSKHWYRRLWFRITTEIEMWYRCWWCGDKTNNFKFDKSN